MLTRSQICQILKPIAEVRAEWNFCRSYIIRYEVILLVKLSGFKLLEVVDINSWRIYEDSRSLPNDADLKIKFKQLNMGVDFIKSFITNLKMDLPLTSEVSRRQPSSEQNKILK